jgi:hypothetical protein
MKFKKTSIWVNCRASIKPGEYKAFVVKGKIQTCLPAGSNSCNPKQRQPEQLLLLSRAYLSFAGSLLCVFLLFFNLGANYRINFYLCKKNVTYYFTLNCCTLYYWIDELLHCCIAVRFKAYRLK